MRPLQMIEINHYDYNNTGQYKHYYLRPKPDPVEMFGGKVFEPWEIELLQSEGYKLMVIKTIDLGLD